MSHPDIDIDVADRSRILDVLPHSAARIDRESGYERHNTGVYFQAIPTDPRDGVATMDHRQAAGLGYFKIDLLNNSVYQSVRDEHHLQHLMSQTPHWDMLLDPSVVSELYHVHNYGPLLAHHRPRSVAELAMFLAIIRPAKRYLQGRTWPEIQREVWTRTNGDDSYQFRKSHATAYAMVICVQLNLIRESRDATSEAG